MNRSMSLYFKSADPYCPQYRRSLLVENIIECLKKMNVRDKNEFITTSKINEAFKGCGRFLTGMRNLQGFMIRIKPRLQYKGLWMGGR